MSKTTSCNSRMADVRAVAIRSYDPRTRSWAIWWLDGRAPHNLDTPVVGSFSGTVGTFLGKRRPGRTTHSSSLPLADQPRLQSNLGAGVLRGWRYDLGDELDHGVPAPVKLYAHPFSSYSQKVLIALYENATPFEYRSLEDPSANAELASLWPLKRFPVLVDQGRTILEATTIIEYLQIHHPGAVRLIPDGDAGVEVRMLDRVFDNYVMTPMQKIVLNQLRPEPIAMLMA